MELFRELDTNESETITIDELLTGFNPMLERRFSTSKRYGIGVTTNVFNHLDDDEAGHLVVEVGGALILGAHPADISSVCYCCLHDTFLILIADPHETTMRT